jgi:hypothetical protein
MGIILAYKGNMRQKHELPIEELSALASIPLVVLYLVCSDEQKHISGLHDLDIMKVIERCLIAEEEIAIYIVEFLKINIHIIKENLKKDTSDFEPDKLEQLFLNGNDLLTLKTISIPEIHAYRSCLHEYVNALLQYNSFSDRSHICSKDMRENKCLLLTTMFQEK